MEILKLELTHSPKVKTIVYEGAQHGFEGFEKNIIAGVLDFVSQMLKLSNNY